MSSGTSHDQVVEEPLPVVHGVERSVSRTTYMRGLVRTLDAGEQYRSIPTVCCVFLPFPLVCVSYICVERERGSERGVCLLPVGPLAPRGQHFGDHDGAILPFPRLSSL